MKTSDFDIQFFADAGDGGGPADASGGVTQSAGGSILTTNAGSVTQQATDQAVQQAVEKSSIVAQPTQQTPLPQPASQVPEVYQPFTLPDGKQADTEQMKEVSALFREMNLTQEQAQKLVDFHSKQWLGAVDTFEQELNRRVADWGEQTKANPEFGGIRLNESLTSVRRAISKLGGGELEKALNETGAINHPGIFAAFVRAGRMFGEDGFVQGAPSGAGGGRTPQDMAKIVYPNMR